MADTTTDLDAHAPKARPEARPSLVLAFAAGGEAAPEVMTIPDDGLLLGRDARVFSAGLQDDSISRRHAEIRVHHGRVRAEDLGSRNGTFVNGERLRGVRALDPGDVVRLGQTLLVYARLSPAAAPGDDGGGLSGVSDAIVEVRRQIALVAGQRRAVLVSGETGTGKELVAEALHAKSGRRGRLVAVNCAALSEQILASELFGHARGAFTGASSDQPGLFRAADGGTLFLDEIGEIPPAVQVALLRALETGRVRPVGRSEEVPVDVAVVAASNRDLVAAVRERTFRADLYARLAQWLVEMPPLRARREDIPYLVRHLAGRAGARDRPLSLPLAEALLLHAWPLNVRGLLNVLSIAALATPSGPLDLVPAVAAALSAGEALSAGASEERRPVVPPEAEALVQAVAEANGSIAEAARRLGCTRQQLYRWLDLRGVDRERLRGR